MDLRCQRIWSSDGSMQRIARIMLALSLLSCRSDGQKLQAPTSGNETPAKAHTPLSAQQRRHLLDGRCDLITSGSAMPNSLKDAFATTTKEESFALADPGTKYQATDVVESPKLPFRRLVFAGRCEDRWFIYYEHGGRDTVMQCWYIEPTRTTFRG